MLVKYKWNPLKTEGQDTFKKVLIFKSQNQSQHLAINFLSKIANWWLKHI